MPRLKSARNTKIKKKCVKSTAYPCGFTCIARYMPNGKERVCRNVLRGQADTFSKWLKMTEERLAKVNAYRSSKGKDTLALKNDVKLVKVKSPQRQETSDSFESAIASPQNVVPIDKKGKVKSGGFVGRTTSIKFVDTVALKPGKQSVDSKIVDDLVKTHPKVGGYIRPMILSSEKPSWASDSLTVVKGNEQAIAAQKALKQNDDLEMTQAIIISEYPKSIQDGMREQLNLLQGLQREIPLSDQGEPFLYDKKKQGKGVASLINARFIDVVSTKVEGVENVDKKLVTDLANSFVKSGGNINPIIVRRTTPDTFEVVSGKLEFLAIQKAKEIDDNLEMFKGIIINNENAAGIIEQTKLFNTIEKNSVKKANSSSNRHPTHPSSAKSKPTREQLIAEENRLGKELDVILNKYPIRRTPEQQREIDAKQAEYRAANRAIRGFNGGKSTDFSERRSPYRNYRR